MRSQARTAVLTAVILLATLAGIVLRCWLEAGRDPVVVRYDVHIPAWPSGRPPATIAFLSDTHVSGEPMGSRINPTRLSRIVRLVDSLRPDMIVLGGDYITSRAEGPNPVSFQDSIAPFARLSAPMGVFGVLGNHDYERGEARDRLMASLSKAGVRPLVNAAIDRGPFVLAGIDDLWFGKPDPKFLSELSRTAKPVVLVSHNPDVFPSVPRSIPLTLAGHTHGAQIVPPLVGPLVSTSQYGQRYRRGLIREDGHDIIVSSGIGGRPFRWNVPPEIVMITVGR